MINIFRENIGTTTSMDLCTVLCHFRINKILPKATTNTEIHNKPYESCDMFDDMRFPLAIILIFVSFNLKRCFQSKSITASSPDRLCQWHLLMSMRLSYIKSTHREPHFSTSEFAKSPGIFDSFFFSLTGQKGCLLKQNKQVSVQYF